MSAPVRALGTPCCNWLVTYRAVFAWWPLIAYMYMHAKLMAFVGQIIPSLSWSAQVTWSFDVPLSSLQSLTRLSSKSGVISQKLNGYIQGRVWPPPWNALEFFCWGLPDSPNRASTLLGHKAQRKRERTAYPAAQTYCTTFISPRGSTQNWQLYRWVRTSYSNTVHVAYAQLYIKYVSNKAPL